MHVERSALTGGWHTETEIKAETKATIRCVVLPGEGPAPEAGKCVKSGAASEQCVLFAKNY